MTTRRSRGALAPALFGLLLLLAGRAPVAAAATFVAAEAGVAVLHEEGQSPPLCCLERETWLAPGARLGGRVGYDFGVPVLVRADLGVALYGVAGQPHLDLRLLSPDAAVYAGGQIRTPVVKVDLAAGVGWRWFTGTATETLGGVPSSRTVSQHVADLRLALGVRAPLGAGASAGGELVVAKVLGDQTLATLSVVLAWDSL